MVKQEQTCKIVSPAGMTSILVYCFIYVTFDGECVWSLILWRLPYIYGWVGQGEPGQKYQDRLGPPTVSKSTCTVSSRFCMEYIFLVVSSSYGTQTEYEACMLLGQFVLYEQTIQKWHIISYHIMS